MYCNILKNIKHMIYVLLLKNRKWYIGYTNRRNGERFDEHFIGKGAKWTMEYKPIQLVECMEGTEEDEHNLTLWYMKQYGWENVRGGNYCCVNMKYAPIELGPHLPDPIKPNGKKIIINGTDYPFINSNSIILQDNEQDEEVDDEEGKKEEKEEQKSITEIDFDSFMKSHITNNEYTHVSFAGIKWLIPDNELDLFYTLYSDEVVNYKRNMSITEKQQDKYGPIIINFTFKYSRSLKSRLTESAISNIIKNITKIVKESFSKTEEFTCIVTKREKMYQDQKSKKCIDEIHIMFPYIVTSYDYQYALREKYINLNMEEDIKEILFEISAGIDYLYAIYDKSVIKGNNWFMYMSTKPNTKPSIIYDIYNSKLQLKDINGMKLVDIVKLLSLRNKTGQSIKSDTYADFIMDYYNGLTFEDEKYSSEVSLNKLKSINYTNEAFIFKLLNILSNQRNDNFSEWIKIGFILHNASINNKDQINYFNVWKDWSQKSLAYIENCCEYYWRKMKNKDNGLELGLLLYYAEMDNKVEYDKIIKENNQAVPNKEYKFNDIITIFANGHRSIAKFFVENHKDEIVFTSSNIYAWNNHTRLWEQCGAPSIKIKISDYIGILFEKYIQQATVKNLYRKIQMLSNLLAKYTDVRFIECIYKYCQPLLENNKFEKIIDSDRHTLNFKNGIYNLRLGIFREREKNDFISKCLEIDYAEKVNVPIKTEILKILKQIANDDPQLLEFNLSYLGYCLTGETALQKFLIVVGYGAQNGKSTMAKMFTKALPIYSAKPDKRTFNLDYTNAHKQFSLIKKPVRFVFMEELNQKKLDTERLKDFVDGDKIGGNEILYGTAENIDIHSKLYFASNKDPVFDTDEGMKRRGLLVTLTNKFYKTNKYNKNKDKKGVYLEDKTIDDKFMTEPYAMAFISILIPYAKKYYEGKFIVPNDIEDDFENLCDENDTMKSFIETHYEITGSDADRIHKDDFVKTYNFYNGTKHTWAILMSDAKRHLTYDRCKRANNLQGALMGIKRKIVKPANK
ncbi:MAG: DNA primase [Barrevirus sp.]|uniref:DNA primase n=1 Tax=Barrevirus sp. TaxID=2487763 RepID=A0A3G4ZPL3_9VIRU|nr:MAG: DNA primase [Barrevirus sp.]